MALFDKSYLDEERNVMVYEVGRYTLEDMGEEERKVGMVSSYIDRIIEKYPQKEEELRKINKYVNELMQSCYENVEELLMLYGMDKILEMLYEVLRNE